VSTSNRPSVFLTQNCICQILTRGFRVWTMHRGQCEMVFIPKTVLIIDLINQFSRFDVFYSLSVSAFIFLLFLLSLRSMLPEIKSMLCDVFEFHLRGSFTLCWRLNSRTQNKYRLFLSNENNDIGSGYHDH